MDSAPDFEQIRGSSLYETPQANNKGWAAYFFTSGNVPAKLPETISITDSLNKYEGCYIFAWQRPPMLDADLDGFIELANDYLSEQSPLNRAAFWLSNPIGIPSFGPLTAFGFQFSADTFGNLVLRSNLNAAIGTNLNFYVISQLGLDVTKQGELIISTSSQQPSIGLQKGLSDLGVQVWDGNSQSVRIPTSGDNTASFVFTGSVATNQLLGKQGIDCGLKYSSPGSGGGGAVQTIYYPALDLKALPASLACIGTVDPSDPVNAQTATVDLQKGYLRSGLIFPGAPSLPSSFRTATGKPISLIPVGADKGAANPPLSAGGLSMASSSAANLSTGAGLAYFAPTGTFALNNPDDTPKTAEALLCGLFGSERLTFTNYDPTPKAANDLLLFIPSCDGYAPIFPFGEATLDDPSSGAVSAALNDTVMTPWVTVLAANADVNYKAEPEGSGLYASQASSQNLIASDAPPILLSAPPSLPLPQGAAKTFPLVPYAGGPSGTNADSVTQFESQILARVRKSIISQGAAATWAARSQAKLRASASNSILDLAQTRATPQGFVAQVDETTGAYYRVAMAQSTSPVDGSLVPFAFNQPTQALQDALETNQLFLVAVNPKNIAPGTGGSTFDNTVYMSGWTMTAQVGSGVTPTSYKNVMIFKFCSGSLLERLGNPNRWTSPADFSLIAGSDGQGMDSLSYTGLSQWAQDYVNEGILRAGGSSAVFYQNFKKIVTDPDWKGILILQADLPITSLPPEIAGLAAGIDFSQFNAHHFGVTVSRIAVDSGGVISMNGNSSLFGLIDYAQSAFALNLASGISPETPIAVQTSEDFNFLVLQLQCLFSNAKLIEFNSYIQLTVGKLFGSTVTQTYSGGVPMPANGIVLKGSYIDQNGSPAYVFQQNSTSVFQLNSNVLPAAAFNRVQFNTLGPRDGGQTMASRFLVWGTFDFTQLLAREDVFDILSFGSAPNTPPESLGQGLSFSNLVLGMSFPVATPNAQSFAVATDTLAYDLAASHMRDGSLFAGFGLQLKSFLNITGTQTPSDLGFLTVQSGINATALTAPWCGVVYQVTLGGPGALASAGGFNSNLLLAWSPSTQTGDASQAVFLGLSLPGASPGAKLFSLQGVLKVSVDSIALQLQDVPDGSGDKFYCLRLDNIGLKVFGIVKLPPDGNIQFFLFGDPKNTGSLGWYAAYVADQSKTTQFIPLNPAQGQPLSLPQEVR